MTSANRSDGSGSACQDAVLAMLLARTSSTSRLLSEGGVAEEVVGRWACALMPVRGDFIQVHTGGVSAFSQQGLAARGAM